MDDFSNLLHGMVAVKDYSLPVDEFLNGVEKWRSGEYEDIDAFLVQSQGLSEAEVAALSDTSKQILAQAEGDAVRGLANVARIALSGSSAAEAAVDPYKTASWTPSRTAASPGANGEKLFTSVRFLKHKKLGRGGMGEVWECKDLLLGQDVAVKFSNGQLPKGEFESEAKIAAVLSHPVFPKVYCVGVSAPDRPWYAMQLVKGKDLREHTEEMHAMLSTSSTPDNGQKASRTKRKKIFDDKLNDCLRAFCKTCSAIGHAHDQGVIHCDISPSNIRISENGEPFVLDWGLALTQTSSVNVGHLSGDEGDLPVRYVRGMNRTCQAPEQARGERPTVKTDVFLLGSSLFQILTGHAPYLGTEPNRLAKEGNIRSHELDRSPVPKALRSICRKAQAPDPDDRFATPAELRAEIEKFLNGAGVKCHADTLNFFDRRLYAAQSLVSKHRNAVAALTVMLVALLAVSSFMWWQLRDANDALAKTNQSLEKTNKELRQTKDQAEKNQVKAEKNLGVVRETALGVMRELGAPTGGGLLRDGVLNSLEQSLRGYPADFIDPDEKEFIKAKIDFANERNDQALSTLDRIRNRFDKSPPKNDDEIKLLSKVLTLIANVDRKSGNLESAAKFAKDALDWRSKLPEGNEDNTRLKANSHANYAAMISMLGKFGEAESHFEAGEKLRQSYSQAESIQSALDRISATYERTLHNLRNKSYANARSFNEKNVSWISERIQNDRENLSLKNFKMLTDGIAAKLHVIDLLNDIDEQLERFDQITREREELIGSTLPKDPMKVDSARSSGQISDADVHPELPAQPGGEGIALSDTAKFQELTKQLEDIQSELNVHFDQLSEYLPKLEQLMWQAASDSPNSLSAADSLLAFGLAELKAADVLHSGAVRRVDSALWADQKIFAALAHSDAAVEIFASIDAGNKLETYDIYNKFAAIKLRADCYDVLGVPEAACEDYKAVIDGIEGLDSLLASSKYEDAFIRLLTDSKKLHEDCQQTLKQAPLQ